MSQNGILFNLKREDISDTGYDIDEPWGYHGKWKELVTEDNTVWFYLDETPRWIKLIETESRVRVAGGLGKEA